MNVRGCSCISFSLLTIYLTLPGLATAQKLLSGQGSQNQVHIYPTDLAIFEAGEARKDLACEVNNGKPVLGFDLRFHNGYEVRVPLRELSGNENLLTILFRVTSEDSKGDPLYFIQKVRVPTIEEGAKGDAYLQGMFDTGEGKYHVDWLMRDRAERICSSSWDLEADLPAKDKQIALMLPAKTVQAADGEQFREEPPVARIQTEPLNVKVMVNFAPQKGNSAALQPIDVSALCQILRSIAREPRITKFSLVAFNLQEQRVVYRQDNADRIDFPALGQALTSLNLGTVDLKRLSQKHGDTDFLSDLIRKETVTETPPDALVFAGPKALLEENVPAATLKDVGELQYPVFYMNYNLYPQAVPWKDSISHAVRYFRGREFTISRPRDLWYAVTEMVSTIVKSKHSKTGVPAASE